MIGNNNNHPIRSNDLQASLYHCTICHLGFSTPQNLLNHFENIHNSRSYFNQISNDISQRDCHYYGQTTLQSYICAPLQFPPHQAQNNQVQNQVFALMPLSLPMPPYLQVNNNNPMVLQNHQQQQQLIIQQQHQQQEQLIIQQQYQ